MNTIFERPTLNRITDRENIAIVDRWIADTVDKLNNGIETGEIANVPTKLSDLQDDSMHRTVTDGEKSNWNSKPSATKVYQTNDTVATSISDTDYVPYSNTSGKRRITWENIKSTLKTYFEGLYAAISHTHTKSQITDFPNMFTYVASGSVSGTSIRIPSSGVSPYIGTNSIVIPVANSNTPIKCKTLTTYEGYVTLELTQSVTNMQMGVFVYNA